MIEVKKEAKIRKENIKTVKLAIEKAMKVQKFPKEKAIKKPKKSKFPKRKVTVKKAQIKLKNLLMILTNLIKKMPTIRL